MNDHDDCRGAWRLITQRWMVWLLVLGAGWLGGCRTNPVTGQKQLALISTEQEIAMGREAAPAFEDEFGGAVDDATLQGYVAGVGRAVAEQADRQEVPYDFTLVRSKVPNAFALPGGKVFITAGLLRRMEHEGQLAAVLGHEIGHVAALHNVNHLQRQMGASLFVELVARLVDSNYQRAAEAAAEVVSGMVNLRYSRQDEYQADRLGIRYMARAGYNPWGMDGLLELLLSLHEQEPGRFEEMFLTHPLTTKRIEQARELIRSEYPQADRDQAGTSRDQFRRMLSRLPEESL